MMEQDRMKPKLVCLSYTITENTQMYKGTPKPRFAPHSSMAKGDSSDSFQIEINSHTATHVDAPGHFIERGRKIGSYTPSELEFDTVEIISIQKKAGEWVERKDLEKSVQKMEAEALLIKTGFSKLIGSEIYRTQNPGLDADAIEWARSHMKNLRMIGVDTISISSQSDSPRGRAAHKAAFEQKAGGSGPLLIVEGMDMEPLHAKGLKRLHLFPWFGGPVDSSPCTIFAEV